MDKKAILWTRRLSCGQEGYPVDKGAILETKGLSYGQVTILWTKETSPRKI